MLGQFVVVRQYIIDVKTPREMKVSPEHLFTSESCCQRLSTRSYPSLPVLSIRLWRASIAWRTSTDLRATGAWSIDALRFGSSRMILEQ